MCILNLVFIHFSFKYDDLQGVYVVKNKYTLTFFYQTLTLTQGFQKILGNNKVENPCS